MTLGLLVIIGIKETMKKLGLGNLMMLGGIV